MIDKHYVILDRDGTIIIEKGYLSDPDEIELLPGAIEGLLKLQSFGLGLIIVTNQSAIGRGFITEKRLSEIHNRLKMLLSQEGVILDGIYYCPCLPEDNCECRKPKPGMVELAARELGFIPSDSFVIGDNICDIELGKRIGATTFLVRTGYGVNVEKENLTYPDFIVDDLNQAAQIIMKLLP